jgi:hypothetical protein
MIDRSRLEKQEIRELDCTAKPTGRLVSRIDVFSQGIYHQSICLIPINQYGKILLQKRDLFEELYPNTWDFILQTSILDETPIETCKRVVKEKLKLGYIVEKLVLRLNKVDYVQKVIFNDASFFNREFRHFFVLPLLEDEINHIASNYYRDLVFLALCQIIDMYINNPLVAADGLRTILDDSTANSYIKNKIEYLKEI